MVYGPGRWLAQCPACKQAFVYSAPARGRPPVRVAFEDAASTQRGLFTSRRRRKPPRKAPPIRVRRKLLVYARGLWLAECPNCGRAFVYAAPRERTTKAPLADNGTDDAPEVATAQAALFDESTHD